MGAPGLHAAARRHMRRSCRGTATPGR